MWRFCQSFIGRHIDHDGGGLSVASNRTGGSSLNFSRTRPPRHFGILCLIVAAHVAGVLLSPVLTARKLPPQRDPASSTLLLVPMSPSGGTRQIIRPVPPRTPPVAVRTTRNVPLAQARPARPADSTVTSQAPLPAAVAPDAARPSAFDPPPLPNPDRSAAASNVPLRDRLIAEFRRDGGSIDRQLRRNSVNPAVRTPEVKETAIASAIAAAYIDRAPARQEEVVLSDGTRVTRIGNICYMKDNGGRTRGMDHISRGTPTVARACWQAGLPMR